MNEKINLQDLSSLLAENLAISKKEAEAFFRTYFEILNEEPIKSGLLKIKDLGAFKLSLMDNRESIDVTTGERVLIPAHYKIVFTPDKKLAEIVNEPFALFETVELKDELESSDLVSIIPEDATKESALEQLIEEEPNLVEIPITDQPSEEEPAPLEIPTIDQPSEEELVPLEIPTIDQPIVEEPVNELETKPFEAETPVEVPKLDKKPLTGERRSIERKPFLRERSNIERKPFIRERDVVEQQPKTEMEPIVKKRQEERKPIGKPVSIYKPEAKEEPVIVEPQEDIDDNDETAAENASTSYWSEANFCFNCHDYEAHRFYKTKYYKTRKKVKQQRLIILLLTLFLLGLLSGLAYLYLKDKPLPFKNSAFIANVTELLSIKNNTSKDSETSSDETVPEEKTEQEEVNDMHITISDNPGVSKQITVVAGQRLTLIAEEEFGDKVFWIYIYLENKDILPNPEVLPVGIKISIPPAEKYGIDSKNPASVQKAKEMAVRIS